MEGTRNSPFVIAISGVSGGGKTTITTLLKEKLNSSKALYFDDYSFDGPEDIREWVESGSDYNAWDLSPLIMDIETLMTQSMEYMVLDYPFAYKHAVMSRFIDFTVFIDTPLDIAMARRILRDFRDGSVERVLWEMENYLSRGRRAYLEMLQTIKPDSEFIIDGSLSSSDIVDEILKQVPMSSD
jgi:uridine kinase